jgi:hypothetical protein
VEVLRARVETLMAAHYRCDRDNEVGAELPGLIRDLHSSIAAGRDVAELLELAVVLHSGATLDHAAELAGRIGQGNAYWMGFGLQETRQWWARTALETGDYERAVAIAEGLHPEAHPLRGRQALYWVNYGQALALRRAARISPNHVRHHVGARETLSELVARAKQDATGRELRAMAYRAGLPV